MNAVEDIPVDIPVTVAGVGDRLRAAREARGLSVADIAQTLKFSPRQVELIERNAWAELPGQTFVRGCIRTYARLVQLDPGPLLLDLESASLPKAAELAVPGTTKATLPMPGRSGGSDRLAVFSGLLVVVVAVAAYFLLPEDFWRNRGNPEAPQARSEPVAAPVAAPVTPPSAPVEAAPAATTEGAATPPGATASGAAAPAVEATVTTPVMPPPAEPPSAENRVRFEFTRPSWVEVRDANGVLLHSQNNAAGSSQEISGTRPMSIVIGDATGVRMVYKDKPVDLAAYTKPNSSVARLIIE